MYNIVYGGNFNRSIQSMLLFYWINWIWCFFVVMHLPNIVIPLSLVLFGELEFQIFVCNVFLLFRKLVHFVILWKIQYGNPHHMWIWQERTFCTFCNQWVHFLSFRLEVIHQTVHTSVHSNGNEISFRSADHIISLTKMSRFGINWPNFNTNFSPAMRWECRISFILCRVYQWRNKNLPHVMYTYIIYFLCYGFDIKFI